MKKLVLQMEKEKLVYEEKYFLALQRATQDKTEAVSKADSLQVKQHPLLIVETDMSIVVLW